MKRAPEPPPMTTRALVLSLALAAAISLFFWNTLAIYPFRLLVTLMHESGHAMMAKLVGGEVVSVTISPGEGGLTMSAYEPTLLKRMLVASAGYLGSSIAGGVMLFAVGRMRSGRLLVWSFVAWMVLVAILWVPFFPPATDGGAAKASGFAQTDGLFTFAFILGLGSVFALVAWKAPVVVRRALIVFLAALSCLASLEDIKSLFGYGLGGSGSDADAMARITHVPAAFWAFSWLAISLLAMFLGVRSILKRRARYARTAGGNSLSFG